MIDTEIRTPAGHEDGDPSGGRRSAVAFVGAVAARAAARCDRLCCPEDDPDRRTRLTWCAVMMAGFVVLLWQVRTGGVVTEIDVRIRSHVLGWSSGSWHALNPVAHAFADLGDTVPAIPVLVLTAVAVALWRRSVRPLVPAALALVMLGCVIVPAKVLIARPGPGTGALPTHQLGYFPSGHTADAMMCFVTAVLILVAGAPPLVRRVAAIATTLLIAAVGASLIWCDYHWTSDVLGSMTLCGTALALIAGTLPRRWPARALPGGRGGMPPDGGTGVRQDG